jgi:hypothetical protein
MAADSEAETAKLKRADAMLDNAAVNDLLGKMVTPAACREAEAHLRSGFLMSERRACRVAAADRSTCVIGARGPMLG